MITLVESYVAKLGLELATTGSAVSHTTNCAREPGLDIMTPCPCPKVTIQIVTINIAWVLIQL